MYVSILLIFKISNWFVARPTLPRLSAYCTNISSIYLCCSYISSIYALLLAIVAVWKLCRGKSPMGEVQAEHCRDVIPIFLHRDERCRKKTQKKELRVERCRVEIAMLEGRVEYCLHFCGERSEKAEAAEHCFGQCCFDEKPAMAAREERSCGGCSCSLRLQPLTRRTLAMRAHYRPRRHHHSYHLKQQRCWSRALPHWSDVSLRAACGRSRLSFAPSVGCKSTGRVRPAR